MVTRLVWCLLLWSCWLPQALGDVTLDWDPKKPLRNESFNLIFTADFDIDTPPDFSPLEAELDIIERNQQSAYRWINGRSDKTTTWVLTVVAPDAPEVVIPAIVFDSELSTARTIKLADPTTTPPTSDLDRLLLEAEVDTTTPYLQQQVIYTVRLWRRIEITNAALSEPELSSDALIKKLGEDRQYDAERSGRTYQVFERRYAIFPQTSGTLVIEPAVLTARTLDRSRSLFSFGGAFKAQRVQSERLTLDVKPIPKTFRGAVWLPAKRVRLHEEWSPANGATTAGEPLTRTLHLWADGLSSGQLPRIPFAVPEGVLSYPDQAQSDEQTSIDGMSAIRQEKVALIPHAAGRFELPPIEVPWWNTETDQAEVARLESFTIQSAAGDTGRNATNGGPATPSIPAATTTITAPVGVASPEHHANLRWKTLALIAALGWLATTLAGLYFWRRRQTPTETPTGPAPRVSTSGAVRALQRACDDADPKAARLALLAWAQNTLPSPASTTLNALAERLEAPLADDIAELHRALYAHHATWSPNELWRHFAAQRRQTPPEAQTTPANITLFRAQSR